MIEEFNSLWVEKYRPQSLDEMIMCEDTREKVKQFAAEGIIPHIFLCSRPGQGKTTLAKVIAYHLLNADVLYLNASENNNVDTVRDTIADFARTMPTPGKDIKIVILDEIDGFASDKAQKLLRGLMEEAADNTRFILTANYRNKVIEAIRSRCLTLDINPSAKEVLKKCLYICKMEGIKGVDQAKMQALLSMVKRLFPDVRSIIKTLQASVNKNGELVIKDYTNNQEFLQEIVNLILGDDSRKLRDYVIEHEPTFNGDYHFLLSDLYHFIIDKEDLSDDLKPLWTIKLAEFISKFQSVVDPELNASACLFTLQIITKQRKK